MGRHIAPPLWWPTADAIHQGEGRLDWPWLDEPSVLKAIDRFYKDYPRFSVALENGGGILIGLAATGTAYWSGAATATTLGVATISLGAGVAAGGGLLLFGGLAAIYAIEH